MKKVKYLILGAGPAGLTFANRLKINGEKDFLVLEKEHEAGGLCRSVDVDGAAFDIGGGHFLDVRRPKVVDFLFQFMGEDEWNVYERDSRIELADGAQVHHPIEANIWEMDIDKQVEQLVSISKAGCNMGEKQPEKFIDWIYWKLGKQIADEYMIPYNQKMFADELNDLGTYWLEKLPNVSFEETLKSCLTKKAYGTQPGHAKFYYPKKYGYGELWLRMAKNIENSIQYQAKVREVDFNTRIVTTQDGTKYQADKIITTIPWAEFESFVGIPDDFDANVDKLNHSAIETRYYADKLDTLAHWIYYPDTSVPYHRILVRHNFLDGSRGYWTETRKERVAMFPAEDEKFTYLNEYAYPINTIDKPKAIKYILDYAKTCDVYGLGRWGEHEHFNSDAVVERAMNLADELGKK